MIRYLKFVNRDSSFETPASDDPRLLHNLILSERLKRFFFRLSDNEVNLLRGDRILAEGFHKPLQTNGISPLRKTTSWH